MIRVCVDAMGGDDAVELVLSGIEKALEVLPDVEVLVAGDEDIVVPFCESHERTKALVTTESIGMGEHPAEAVRTKRDSSIVRGCRAVREGEADAFFSAGSTGAILTAATLEVGRIKGMRRPALAVALPGLSGKRSVVLDLGANADCKPEMILQFAHMGTALARTLLGVEEPRVALLSNGEEDAKGNEATIKANELLHAKLPNFAGNCEGTDILAGRFDVIVADGFTANVMLKTLEGTAKFIIAMLMNGAKEAEGGLEAISTLKPVVGHVASLLSGDAYGGAVLLGLKAPVFVGHGSTSAEAVKNGIIAAADAVRGDLVERITEFSKTDE